MMKRVIRCLAIVMNVCVLVLTSITLVSLSGGYDMEWAQTPLIIAMICTPPLSIIALLPADARRASRQRRIERIAGALARHHNVTVPSGLSPEVERLASDPRQRKAAIRLQSKQTRASRAEAKADIEAFLFSAER